jgi:hypothetical protein
MDMLKRILKLEGAKELSINDQKIILRKLFEKTSFPCSCNGMYRGDCDTFECCRDLCSDTIDE